LFNIVERSGNYVLEDINPPTFLRARVLSFALGLYNVEKKTGRINFGGG